MDYVIPFLLGLACGIAGMLGTPTSREQMRERKMELRNAYLRGYAAGQLVQKGQLPEGMRLVRSKP